MSHPFHLEICTDPIAWDSFVRSSPQGTVYSDSRLLSAFGIETSLLFVRDGKEVQLAAPVFLKNSQPLTAPYYFSLYQGILFGPKVEQEPPHTRHTYKVQLVDFLLKEMTSRYDFLSFCFHPSFSDLRALQWLHYHEPEKGRFQIELSYTSRLDLQAFTNFDQYLASTQRLRRRQHKAAIEARLQIAVGTDIDALVTLYEKTFLRQNLSADPQELKLIRNITAAALSGGFGRLLTCKNMDGVLIAATFFMFDEKCGYSVFAGNDPEYRDLGAGTFLLLDNIRRCMEDGLSTVDFVGINSPQRGDYKLSFNGLPTPYFTAHWKKSGIKPEKNPGV